VSRTRGDVGAERAHTAQTEKQGRCIGRAAAGEHAAQASRCGTSGRQRGWSKRWRGKKEGRARARNGRGSNTKQRFRGWQSPVLLLPLRLLLQLAATTVVVTAARGVHG
jgi:hypothetical protein